MILVRIRVVFYIIKKQLWVQLACFICAATILNMFSGGAVVAHHLYSSCFAVQGCFCD